MNDIELPDEMRDEMQAAWHRYLDRLNPFRPDLYRYCRKLTGDIWDAQDLVQDTLMRGFATLGAVHHTIEYPKAYLLRIASNHWIDTVRRRNVEGSALRDEAVAGQTMSKASPDARVSSQLGDAAAVLMQRLAPQEQAALVLKDVFEMSLEETAGILSTTVGAVKAALHRGRGKLTADAPTIARPSPSPELVDEFVDRYNKRDLEGLLELMLDTASVDMLGHVSEAGRPVFGRDGGWFSHNFAPLEVIPESFRPESIRWSREEFLGEQVVLVLYRFGGHDLLGSVMRLEELEGRVSRIRVYACCPEVVQEVGEALQFPVLPGMYRIPDFLLE